MSVPLIEFRSVEKRFGDNLVLKGVNLSIYKGCITAVIGKSGTGKSVLLKHIIGLVKQDHGQLLINGDPLHQMDKADKKRFLRQLSYMFQDNALFDFLNIHDNIALPLAEAGQVSKSLIRDRVRERMNQLGLEGTGNQFPMALSGGMRKRVALARALVTDPKVVLFDEPTTGLDPVRKRNVHTMIKDYQEQFGFTAVIVSHDIPAIFDVAQQIAMLDQGIIAFEGTREEILNSPDDRIRNFVLGRET